MLVLELGRQLVDLALVLERALGRFAPVAGQRLDHLPRLVVEDAPQLAQRLDRVVG